VHRTTLTAHDQTHFHVLHLCCHRLPIRSQRRRNDSQHASNCAPSTLIPRNIPDVAQALAKRSPRLCYDSVAAVRGSTRPTGLLHDGYKRYIHAWGALGNCEIICGMLVRVECWIDYGAFDGRDSWLIRPGTTVGHLLWGIMLLLQ
jgi:hypothetical protein